MRGVSPEQSRWDRPLGDPGPHTAHLAVGQRHDNQVTGAFGGLPCPLVVTVQLSANMQAGAGTSSAPRKEVA